MREVVIVCSVRTPVGRAVKGTLRATRPDELGAIAIKGALDRVPQLDPKEIEDVLYAHPSVLDAAVVGRTDPLYGEEPVAFVVLRPGLATEPQELMEHCTNALARFKVPRAIFIEANLPVTPIGKIAKQELRKRI